MKKTVVALTAILISSILALAGTHFVNLASALYLGLVTIKADGTVYPADAPIQRIKEVYILTDDIESIRVEKSNIVLDGNGHMLPGEASSLPTGVSSYSHGVLLNSVENVTVKNLIIQNVATGISLDRTTKCIIANNTITGTHVAVPQLQSTGGIFVWAGNSNTITENQLTNNYNSIYLGYNSQQNTITRNNITDSVSSGVIFWDASDNFFYNNSFIDNAMQVAANEDRVNFWDNGSVGNFWSNYNGTDSNRDGIGDTPYVIDANNQDNYPLMASHKEPLPTPTPTPTPEPQPEAEPFPTVLVVASVIIAALVGTSLLVYFKKRKH